MSSNRSIIPLTLLLLSPACLLAQLAGKSGEGLCRAIAESHRPVKLASDPTTLFALTDGNLDKTMVLDRFDDKMIPIGEATAVNIAPAVWWTKWIDPSLDLYNTVPASNTVENIKLDYPPGNVSTPKWDNGLWMVGTTSIAGFDTDFFTPPVPYRGDMARIYMYVATLYATPSLSPRAFMMMDGKQYPSLTALSAATLLDWHRSDPPDNLERERNNAIGAIQGNRNPFVDSPELAEYLWGVHKGEIYSIQGEKTPLHSTYTLAEQYLHLISPHIPDDAIWKIDGSPVSEISVSLATIGVGAHHLEYKVPSTGTTGCLMIQVVQ